MSDMQDFLLEIHTEELPAKLLLPLAENLSLQIKERLQKAQLTFSDILFFVTPRRLAVQVLQLSASQPDQIIERKGPAKHVAFDSEGQLTAAAQGFVRSTGANPDELIIIENNQGAWIGLRQKIDGQSVWQLLPALIEEAVLALVIPKRMRWGEGEVTFVRPIHSILMLYGEKIIANTLLGLETGRVTYGHRFLAPQPIEIFTPKDYLSRLEGAYVVADFAARRERIILAAQKCLLDELGIDSVLVVNNELINEVTGLVEWPIVLLGKFDPIYLNLPEEVLISSMQDHQRYFPVRHAKNKKLLEYFICVSNIESENPIRVIHGNERVLRARLSDAAFFFESDKKERLEDRMDRLRGIVFQAKLGTLYDKAQRVSQLAAFIAKEWNENEMLAQRAGLLAKTDLTTHMVGEFPELQGIMGSYYALHDGEAQVISLAIKEHYQPAFAKDSLPIHSISQALAIADRMDTLVGTFGIQQIPTGEKDPFALRRSALGVLRILIEKEKHLDLKKVLEFAFNQYDSLLDKKISHSTIEQVFYFIQERLRAWYMDRGVSSDVLSAVMSLGIQDPLDVDARIQAVQAFKQLSAAETLSIANKRVSNILSKYVDKIEASEVDPSYFEHAAEKELARQLEIKDKVVLRLTESRQYQEVLLQLADLRKPVDDFFEQVMVMTEDKKRRENRILLLSQLRNLFLKVADIALLQ